MGAADAEELHIQSVYDTGAQTLDFVLFQTDAASASANKGLFKFNVDGTDILNIADGGINLVTGKAYFINSSNVLSGTTLGTGVLTSSLTSVGTLSGGDVTTQVSAASLTLAGRIEIATGAETNTGTDATRAVSPDGLDDWTGSAQMTTLGTITPGYFRGPLLALFAS